MGFPGDSVVKNPPANARDMGLIPGPGRSPGEGNGNSLQYSCLGNFMHRGAWQATAHVVTKSQTRLRDNVQLYIVNLIIWKTPNLTKLEYKWNSEHLWEIIRNWLKYIIASPIRRWNLRLRSLDLDLSVTCFDKDNLTEVLWIFSTESKTSCSWCSCLKTSLS